MYSVYYTIVVQIPIVMSQLTALVVPPPTLSAIATIGTAPAGKYLLLMLKCISLCKYTWRGKGRGVRRVVCQIEHNFPLLTVP